MKPYYDDAQVTLLEGDAVRVLKTLPAESIQTVVTSPPYWGLRDYGVPGQLGLEPAPEEYVVAVCDVFVEIWRVLRNDGTVWLNLGDSYAVRQGATAGKQGQNGQRATRTFTAEMLAKGVPSSLKTKDLIGIPWRVAFALQWQGWYLRADIIWSKPNPMPESVTDRPTKAHEYLFLLSKAERYYYDASAIREPSVSPEQEAHNQRYAKPYAAYDDRAGETGQPGNVNSVGIHSRPGPGGRNKRSVWEIATAPYPEAHFATFPPDLIKPCILAGCPEGGTVLDPFVGSGTTALVAKELGRKAIGVDLNPAYLELARKRLGQETIWGIPACNPAT